jgi:membrane protease YdiL (CAAX protease family)
VLGINNDPVNQQILESQLNGPFFDRASLAIFAVLLAPLVEEMVFRLAGFRLLGKIEGLPIAVTIAITSLLFGLIHVLSDDIVQILYYAGLGVVLGLVYHKSKNILVPIGVHMLFNLFVVITMFAGL